MRASHIERARHRADLARRSYLAVDPGNRLVAGTLDADWNQALLRGPRAERGQQRGRWEPTCADTEPRRPT